MVRMASFTVPSIAKAIRLCPIAIEWSKRVEVLAMGTGKKV